MKRCLIKRSIIVHIMRLGACPAAAAQRSQCEPSGNLSSGVQPPRRTACRGSPCSIVTACRAAVFRHRARPRLCPSGPWPHPGLPASGKACRAPCPHARGHGASCVSGLAHWCGTARYGVAGRRPRWRGTAAAVRRRAGVDFTVASPRPASSALTACAAIVRSMAAASPRHSGPIASRDAMALLTAGSSVAPVSRRPSKRSAVVRSVRQIRRSACPTPRRPCREDHSRDAARITTNCPTCTAQEATRIDAELSTKSNTAQRKSSLA